MMLFSFETSNRTFFPLTDVTYVSPHESSQLRCQSWPSEVRQLFTNGEMARLTFSNEQQLHHGWELNEMEGFFWGKNFLQGGAPQVRTLVYNPIN